MSGQVASLSPRSRWYVGFLIATLAIVVPSVFLEGHFFFGVAFADLVGSAFAYSFLFLISAPFFYWGRSCANGQGRDFRPLCLVGAFFVGAFGLLTAFFGAHLGIVSSSTAQGFAVATLVMTPLGFLAAYFVHKKFFSAIRQS